MAMKLGEPTPAALTRKIRRRLARGEEELIRIASDLTADGSFGSLWVVVTGERLLIVPPERDDGVVELLLREIAAARAETLVGGGCLEIAWNAGPLIRIPYSASLSDQFAEVARGIEQLRKGEPLLIRTEPDRVRCENCGRRLPEKNGICPACIRRLAVLRRITTYLNPYKGHVLLIILASLAITLLSLLPPIIIRRIIDDVLLPRETVAPSLDRRLSFLGFLVLALFGLRVLSWGAEWVHGWVVAW